MLILLFFVTHRWSSSSPGLTLPSTTIIKNASINTLVCYTMAKKSAISLAPIRCTYTCFMLFNRLIRWFVSCSNKLAHLPSIPILGNFSTKANSPLASTCVFPMLLTRWLGPTIRRYRTTGIPTANSPCSQGQGPPSRNRPRRNHRPTVRTRAAIAGIGPGGQLLSAHPVDKRRMLLLPRHNTNKYLILLNHAQIRSRPLLNRLRAGPRFELLDLGSECPVSGFQDLIDFFLFFYLSLQLKHTRTAAIA